jgi:hypothetical protein
MQAGLSGNRLSFSTIHSIDDGRPAAPVRLGAKPLVPLVAADGIIVASLSDGSIALVGEFYGREIGRLQVPEFIAVTPAIHRGFLYIAAGKNVFAFDLPRYLDQQSRLGFKPTWSFAAAGSNIIRPLLVDAGAIYLVSQDGGQAVLEAISPRDGRRVWPDRICFDSCLLAPPVVVEDFLLVIRHTGEVSLIDPGNGRVLDTYSIGRSLDQQVTPYVVGKRVLLVDTGNNVVELEMTAGGPIINVLYSHRARITCLSASGDYIAIGHMAGLTLLSSGGHLKWSNDSIEPILVAPLIAGESVFAVDSSGTGLLFDALRSNPKTRVKLLSGEVNTPPILTRSKIVAASGGGDLTTVAWN